LAELAPPQGEMCAEEGEGPPAELGGFSKDSRLPLRLRIPPAGDADLGLSVATLVSGAPGISSARWKNERRLAEGYFRTDAAHSRQNKSSTAAVAISYVSGASAVAISFVSGASSLESGPGCMQTSGGKRAGPCPGGEHQGAGPCLSTVRCVHRRLARLAMRMPKDARERVLGQHPVAMVAGGLVADWRGYRLLLVVGGCRVDQI
jgi:hypothetical protein